MARHFKEPKLLIASGNAGKVKEIKELLAEFPVEVLSAKAFDLPEPEETGATFVENARLKAQYYGMKTGLPALADDSGLVIDALDGAPGIYSARWAGPDKDFTRAFDRIRQEIKQKFGDGAFSESAKLQAHFVCALSLRWPDGQEETVEGKVFGTLTFLPRGIHGFGYDPIFIPQGSSETFGEMEPARKHAISHRADAFNKLVTAVFQGID